MSAPTGELIPDAIEALLATAKALKSGGQLAAVGTVPAPDVYDGADVAAVSGRYLAIGVDGADDIAATARMGQAGLGSRTRQDTAAITCLAFAGGGNSDLRDYRDAAFAWYRALRHRLEGDPRLGGRVTFAQVVSVAYRPQRTGPHAAAGVEFVVQVTSL